MCRLTDSISSLETCLEGYALFFSNGGCVYFPDKQECEKYYKKMKEEDRKYFDNYKANEAPLLLKKLKAKLERSVRKK